MESRMNLFRFIRSIGSAPVVRKRLQVLVEYERRVVRRKDLLAVSRQEILTVVSRLPVDPDKGQVWVDRGHKVSVLVVGVEIPIRARGSPYR
jgi:cell division topological specificity factor MinE